MNGLGCSFEDGLSGRRPPACMQCGPQPSLAWSRGRRCGARRLPGSRPFITIGSQVHFCLCHLPSHLKGSHDGFITFLNSFQLSLITLRISKSSLARADRERNRPSTMLSWGSLPHLQQVPLRQPRAISAACRWEGHQYTMPRASPSLGHPCI